MVSLLWPIQALFSAPGPLETLLSRKHDSINLLTPPSDTDRHLRWRQANSEDIGTVHISEETLNQPEELRGDSGCLFQPAGSCSDGYAVLLYLRPIFNPPPPLKKKWNWQWWNGLGGIAAAMPFWLLEFTPRTDSQDVRRQPELWRLLHSGHQRARYCVCVITEKNTIRRFIQISQLL